MCWWSPCLQDGISCNTVCFTGRNVLLDDMFLLHGMYCMRACPTVPDVLLEYMFTEGHT